MRCEDEPLVVGIEEYRDRVGGQVDPDPVLVARSIAGRAGVLTLAVPDAGGRDDFTTEPDPVEVIDRNFFVAVGARLDRDASAGYSFALETIPSAPEVGRTGDLPVVSLRELERAARARC